MNIFQTGRSSLAGCCGGIGVRIVLVIATLVCVGGAVSYLTISLQKKLAEDGRKALEISEYGLQEALLKLGDAPSSTVGLPRTPYNGGWFAVTMTPAETAEGTFLKIESEGHCGSVVKSRDYLLKLTVSEHGDSLWAPQIRL